MRTKLVSFMMLSALALLGFSSGAQARSPLPPVGSSAVSSVPAAASGLGTDAAAQPASQPAGSAFTYQGKLLDNGQPVSGQYDFTFKLFDEATGGNQIGSTNTANGQPVSAGLFTVYLNFGSIAFTGDARWLETAVRPTGGGGFTTLSPRQPLTSAPYAQSLVPGAVISGDAGSGGTLTVDNTHVGSGTGVLALGQTVGLFGVGVGSSGTGVRGLSSGGDGVYGTSASGNGVYGSSTSGTGVFGRSAKQGVSGLSTSGIGVLGSSTNGYGVLGQGGTVGTGGTSVIYGGIGVAGAASGSNSIGVRGQSSGMYGKGVYGIGSSVNSVGVHGEANGVYAKGVYGTSTDGYGVYGLSTNGSGVYGESTSGDGVAGFSTDGYGVFGQSQNDRAVWGRSFYGTGVYGSGQDYGGSFYGVVGVYGISSTSNHNYAGYFAGNVRILGTCCAMAEGYSQIDHPLDPANKVLNQSFVQSPDMLDVYSGNATTGANGEAVVQLPPYFEALNKDFRYQLTVIGQFAQAIVSSKVQGNRFTIKTDKPNVEVSWQVTGVRQDNYAKAHPISAEQAKEAKDKGKYLHPAEAGQPESMGVDYEELQKMRDAVRTPPATPSPGK